MKLLTRRAVISDLDLHLTEFKIPYAYVGPEQVREQVPEQVPKRFVSERFLSRFRSRFWGKLAGRFQCSRSRGEQVPVQVLEQVPEEVASG